MARPEQTPLPIPPILNPYDLQAAPGLWHSFNNLTQHLRWLAGCRREIAMREAPEQDEGSHAHRDLTHTLSRFTVAHRVTPEGIQSRWPFAIFQALGARAITDAAEATFLRLGGAVEVQTGHPSEQAAQEALEAYRLLQPSYGQPGGQQASQPELLGVSGTPGRRWSLPLVRPQRYQYPAASGALHEALTTYALETAQAAGFTGLRATVETGTFHYTLSPAHEGPITALPVAGNQYAIPLDPNPWLASTLVSGGGAKA